MRVIIIIITITIIIIIIIIKNRNFIKNFTITYKNKKLKEHLSNCY